MRPADPWRSGSPGQQAVSRSRANSAASAASFQCAFKPLGLGSTQIRVLRPEEQEDLLPLGLGITNVVARATARADELTADEVRAGGRVLTAKVARLGPQWLAVVGITVYRTAFGRPGATTGRQEETLGGARLWVLPNPSGLNAHWNDAALAAEFARLREAAC